MADVLVDTEVFMDHLRGAHELQAGKHRLAYFVVTRAELFAGTTATDAVARLLSPLREFPIDRAVAERAGRIRRDTRVCLPDALIGATALEHGLQLAHGTRPTSTPSGLRVTPLS